jgi:hypothetical protein
VDEGIWAAIIWCDKAKAFLAIKPFYCSGSHRVVPFIEKIMPACAGMFGVNISGDIFERNAECFGEQTSIEPSLDAPLCAHGLR